MTNVFYLIHFFLCISIFCLVYGLSYSLSKKNYYIIRNNLYIIIPLYCILCWALYFAIFVNPYLGGVYYDFTNFYYCGQRVLEKPEALYDFKYSSNPDVSYGYKYFPNFAVIIGIPLSLIPSLLLAYRIWYIINIILAMILLLLFNQILILLNLKRKTLRFLFLFSISNGFFILRQFRNNQMKFFLGVIILFILKQEIRFRMKEFEKDFKFYLKTYNLFILVIGTFPPLLFFFLIYIFQDIPKSELFKKANLKKYSIIIISFIAQNFLFILYPSLIRSYYKVVRNDTNRKDLRLNHFYLQFIEDFIIDIPKLYENYISTTLNIIWYIIVALLILIRKLRIEEKFGLLSISIILLNYVAYRIMVILLPLTSLLFIPYLLQDKNGIEFIKRNKVIILGLICILCINLFPYSDSMGYPYFDGITLAHLILVITLGICIVYLYKKKYERKKNPEEDNLKKTEFLKKNGADTKEDET